MPFSTKPTIIDKRTDICPYCNTKLAKIPAAKTVCKECGNEIFVRTNINREKVTCTLAQKEQIEEEINEKYALERLQSWITNQVFATPQSKVYNFLQNTKKKWESEGLKFKVIDLEYSVGHFMIELILTTKKKGRIDYFAVAQIYSMLADIDVKEGRDPTRFLKEMEKYNKLEDKALEF